MSDFIMAETTDRAVCFLAQGGPKPENFVMASAACQAVLDRRGELRVLVYFKDFGKWDEKTSQMDMGFSMDYGSKMTRLALVNPPPHIINLFKIKEGLHSNRQVRYYPENEFADALAWVNEAS
jgi:hypothetical protein